MTSHAVRPTRSTATLRRRGTFAVAAAAVAVATLGAASPAFAKNGDGTSGGDAVKSSATCAFGGAMKLKVKPDHGKYETEVEINTKKAGQDHLVTISLDGTDRWSGTLTTGAATGSASTSQLLDPAVQPATGGGTDDKGGAGNGGGTDDKGGNGNGGAGDDNPGAGDNNGGGNGGGDDTPGAADNHGGKGGKDDNPGAHGVAARSASVAAAVSAAAAPAAAPATTHTFKVVSVFKGVSCAAEDKM